MLSTALQSSLCLFSLPGALSSFVLFCKCLYFPPLITSSLSPLPFPWVAPSVIAPSYKSHGKGFSRGASSHLVDLFPLLWMKGQCSCHGKVWSKGERGDLGRQRWAGGDKLAAPAAGRVVAVAAQRPPSSSTWHLGYANLFITRSRESAWP